jgi:hypothetical protein
MALNCLWPEGAAVTKRSDPHDFIFIMEITIYFRGRWNVTLRVTWDAVRGVCVTRENSRS